MTDVSEPTGARRDVFVGYQTPAPPRDRYWLHLLLFLITLASTAFTGAQFVGRVQAYLDAPALFELLGLPVSWPFILDGLRFAGSLLLFLTVHEFGHYFAARYHGVSTSLPYYIPSPFLGIGTLGAVIRIREAVPSLRKLFDIGAAGPIAGFVVALGVLFYALATVPPPDYLLTIGGSGHEGLVEYFRQNGSFPQEMPPVDTSQGAFGIVIGQTGLYWFLSQFFDQVPPMYEMYHYPFLFAGWLGLFFTALNLLPVGQLDGGHILYALVGPKWHTRLARGFVFLLLTSMSIGFVDGGLTTFAQAISWLQPHVVLVEQLSWFVLAALLYPFLGRIFKGDHRKVAPALLIIVLIAVVAKTVGPVLTQFGYTGWIFFSLLLVFFIRVEHPPVLYVEPLTPGRRALAILCIFIFLLCFSIKPISVV